MSDRNPKPLGIVLASGGLDSCVAAAIAGQTHRLALLHINYGQRTEARELRAFHHIADHYEAARRLVVDFRHLAQIGGSSLTDTAIEVSSADLENPEIPSSYVPFRNANLLAVAVSWAEVIHAETIFIGAVYEDASGYPDCRPVFYEAFGRVIETGTKPETHIGLVTPIIDKSKAEIIRLGAELQAPLEHTWSCYQREDVACGVCDSCAFRLRGFQQAGIEDPIPYATRPPYV
ncbi:MAG: 7-cyano-7-deazaguanine synthase [Kiritimatiellia bacterium]|jgi:7-cyano-7-deazaguanine synthase